MGFAYTPPLIIGGRGSDSNPPGFPGESSERGGGGRQSIIITILPTHTGPPRFILIKNQSLVSLYLSKKNRG
uniref:Uncharacterized protein n=1 Tax=Psilotum nudum TaxID=3240 RepID=Q8W8K5_PSINU|nr:hypothetical protein PsnuCp075 [Psilotum nudum]NP_569698.1 hypothetical protein PsnuCp093 [Psilotum nudum]BAB84269.1 hypothetical protein [Psilotum nudum]BAB84287.1 hypothetical protein [Psilotum nudum]